MWKHIDGLVQERHNFIANTLELCFLAQTHRYMNLRIISLPFMTNPYIKLSASSTKAPSKCGSNFKSMIFKPIMHEPMLTEVYITIWCHWATMS